MNCHSFVRNKLDADRITRAGGNRGAVASVAHGSSEEHDENQTSGVPMRHRAGRLDREDAWVAVKALVEKAVRLYHPRQGYRVMVFPDASDLFWGSCVTQVPSAEVDSNMPVEEMSHEPMGFLSGAFKGPQLRWPTVDKEAFAVVSTFRRLAYLLWDGAKVYSDHRNLQYILHPGGPGPTVSKQAGQTLQG